MLKIVEELSNASLSQEKWNQASLRIRFGGIGIRKIGDVALPAFLSTVNSVLLLVQAMLSYIADLGNVALHSRAIEQ